MSHACFSLLRPIVDRLAAFGEPRSVRFTLAKIKGNPTDFSFSGLKTAVLRWTEEHNLAEEVAARKELLRRTPRPDTEQWLTVTPRRTLDLLASFQHTVVEELLRRVRSCAETTNARTVIISGGVACNSALRSACEKERLAARILFPTPGLSTDNAAMIAAAAFRKLERRDFAGMDLAAKANLPLDAIS